MTLILGEVNLEAVNSEVVNSEVVEQALIGNLQHPFDDQMDGIKATGNFTNYLPQEHFAIFEPI